MGTSHLRELASAAPVNFNSVKNLDWDAVTEALGQGGIDPGTVLAVSWCQLGMANIEANIESDALAVIAPTGVLATAGKRKMMGKAVKCVSVEFSAVRAYGPVEHEDPRNYGRFGIAFAGAGNVMLGRLQWSWQGKRFRDSRREIMAVAEERDRILSVVSGVLG